MWKKVLWLFFISSNLPFYVHPFDWSPLSFLLYTLFLLTFTLTLFLSCSFSLSNTLILSFFLSLHLSFSYYFSHFLYPFLLHLHIHNLTHLLLYSLFFHLICSMNAPTDGSRWFMTPQTINAYYHPSLNEIVFPAAILQVNLFYFILFFQFLYFNFFFSHHNFFFISWYLTLTIFFVWT